MSAWLTPGGSFALACSLEVRAGTDRVDRAGVKIILLHELKNDEGIRLFLQDTWESYAKVCGRGK